MFQLIRPIQRWIDRFTATPEEVNEQCDLSAQGMLQRTKKIAIATTPDGSEEDSGFDFPDVGVVVDIYVNVRVAEATGATKQLDVGLLSTESGGDADGFAVNIDVSTTGLKKATLHQPTGQTRGALLVADEDGAGALVPEVHVLNGTAKSLCWTAGSGDWVEFEGDIYAVYGEIG